MTLATTAAVTLSAEVTAIMADVVGYDGAAIAGLSWALGRRYVPEHHAPPRVVWVLGGGAGGAPQKPSFPGGRRSLATRNLTLRAVCWGADVDAALDLSSAVAAAVARRYAGRVRLISEEWVEDPALLDLGEAVTLSWPLQVAVLDRAPSRVTVTSAIPDTSTAAVGDGVLHLGAT